MQGRHFWTHFWVGLIVGSCWGAYTCYGIIDGLAAFIGCTAVIALVFALAVGYWGDPLWRRLLDWWGR